MKKKFKEGQVSMPLKIPIGAHLLFDTAAVHHILDTGNGKGCLGHIGCHYTQPGSFWWCLKHLWQGVV